MATVRIEDLFRREGQPVVFSGGSTFPLNGQDAVFLVTEGTVNVVALPVNEEARPGSRTHLHRVGPGEILLSPNRRDSAALPPLLAEPAADVKALRLPQTRFHELLADEGVGEETGALLWAWVDKLAAGLSYRRIEDIFLLRGQSPLLSANQPLLLHRQDTVLLVMEGAVDIFAVPLVDGKADGSRTYLYRAGQQQIVPGLHRAEFAGPFGLMAVAGPQTSVLSLPCAHFYSFLAETELCDGAGLLLATWFDGLASGLSCKLPPKETTELTPGTGMVLQPQQSTGTSGELLWVRHREGSSLFLGHEAVAVAAEPHYIPHPRHLWLTAREPAVLEVTTSSACALEDPALPGLTRFHDLLLAFVGEVVGERLANEAERWRRQALSEQASLQRAMAGIADLLNVSEQGSGQHTAAPEGDPLHAACRLVGGAQGIVIHCPPLSEEQDLDARLQAVARASRMRTRRVLLTGEWWRQDHGPLLGILKGGNRPVALLQETEKRTRLHDPADCTSREVHAGIAGQMTPFAYQFYRPLPDGYLSPAAMARFVLPRIRKDLQGALALGVLGALLALAIPVGTGVVFNTVIPEAARSQMVQLAILLLACAIGVALLDVVKGLALLRIETKTEMDAQAAVMDRLLSLPVAFFHRYTAGDLAKRVLGVSVIREVVSLFTIQSGVAGLFALFNLVLMFWYDAGLASVATLFVAASALVLALFNILQLKRIRLMADMEGRIAGVVLQFITGIAKLRVAGAENLAFARWIRDFSGQRRFAYRVGVFRNLQALFNAIFPALGLLLLFGWITRYRNDLRTGDFLAFLAAFTNVQTGLFQVSAAFSAMLAAAPLFERMKPILEAIPETDDSKTSPGELNGRLEIRNVTFRYQQDGPEILRDVSLEVNPGQFVALVGGSGSGKSTLLRLLMGFEHPQTGGVYYDGKDLAVLDCREVRRQIGVVLQDSSVTPGSIMDNIRGATNLPMEDVWEAARMAGLDGDIRDMPMGLHTFVSPGGESLSGGQRQRLLIARSLIRKPRLLFFDEATSALDNHTQEIVSRSLAGLRATRVIIAHRLSTVVGADCIHVLERGRIVESGTYDDLIQQNGVFATLVKRQMI